MEKNKFLKFSLIFSNTILFFYLFYRLLNQSKILKYFPLDITNDISSHMGQLYFLKVCGFHNVCTYWYHGHELLKFYPPGWFFFSYPLLLAFKNVELATYISIILMLLISFVTIYKIIKLKEKSWLKSISFFLFLFATATSISAFFRLGRVTEMFGWVIFLILTYQILKYKDKKIDYLFMINFSIFYAVLLFSQPIVAIPFHFFLLSLFLVKLKNKRELIKLILSIFLGLLLSSFWWYPFVSDLGSESRTYEYLPEITSRFFDFNSQWRSSVILITLFPIITLIMFYLYYNSKGKDKKELLFFSPILVIALLVVTRLVTLIPYLNYVYPEPYLTFFTIFSLIFLFNTNIEKLQIMQSILPFLIIFLAIISTLTSFFVTSYYLEHTSLESNTIELLKEVNNSYMILESPSSTSYSKAYYSYAAIYHNLSTPSGWSPSELTKENQILLAKIGEDFRNENCLEFINTAKNINLSQVITYNEFCNLKEKCNFRERLDKENVCLLKI